MGILLYLDIHNTKEMIIIIKLKFSYKQASKLEYGIKHFTDVTHIKPL